VVLNVYGQLVFFRNSPCILIISSSDVYTSYDECGVVRYVICSRIKTSLCGRWWEKCC